MTNNLSRVGQWLVTAAVPFFLIMTAIRLLILPWYPQVEYRMPYFPPDSYGFTFEERMHWAGLSIDYLNNSSDITFLADLRLQDGNPLYNDRELSHMLDVKILIQKMTLAWEILAVLLGAALLGAWRAHWLQSFAAALANGGRLTITVILCILALVAVSFNWLFTMFHRLFFSGDTWLFLFSDSLIRLFPIPFWRDSFILMGLFTIGAAVLLIIFGGRAARSA